jgi:ABC-type nitrate/sulfonate/bicarbonate transport system permease component
MTAKPQPDGGSADGLDRHRTLLGVLAPLAVLIAWEAYARTGGGPSYLVAPTAILAVTFDMATNGELWPHVGASLVRAYGGFALGAIAGILLGLFAGVSRAAGTFLDPLVSLTYPVPKVVVLPILVVWLGFGDASKVATIAVSVFFPVFINAYSGTRAVPKLYVWAARNMGARPKRTFFRVVLPAAMSHVLAGIRIGLALSFVVLFAAELFGAPAGLGYLIGRAEESGRFDLMFVAILAIAFIGFLTDRAFVALRRRLLVGQTLSREEAGF